MMIKAAKVYNVKNNPVDAVDFSAPSAGKIVFQRFWFADAEIAVAHDIPDTLIDFTKRYFV